MLPDRRETYGDLHSSRFCTLKPTISLKIKSPNNLYLNETYHCSLLTA